MIKRIKKRSGEFVPFDAAKIVTAITKANRDVAVGEKLTLTECSMIAEDIASLDVDEITVEDVQDLVEENLMKMGRCKLAREYVRYRFKRELLRDTERRDDAILAIVRNEDKEAMEENSNKNTRIAATQRDYLAGAVSKDVSKRVLLPKSVIDAHENGILHFHDLDYFIQPIFNCCLINIKDMLDNGTVMNGKLIESPKSFRVACTVTTQIMASVASNQYGGQSVDVSHLGKYVAVSREKFRRKVEGWFSKYSFDTSCCNKEQIIDRIVEDMLAEEIAAGVQTIQYQINTLMTTNGQSPFVTLFLRVADDNPFKYETAMIVEEIFKQRIKGIKNEKGVYITPAFPKLIYVLDDNNILNGGEFDYLTKLAVECSAKRMYPDYISAKKMKENYADNVFSCMGCRSFLSPWYDEDGNAKFEGRFNQGVVSINLPQIGLIARGDEEVFWPLLEERLALCFEALMCRHRALEETVSDVSPIHWQHGAIARLEKGETIDKLLHGGYSTLSLGYIGLYEVTKLMTGFSHTSDEGTEFALRLMQKLRETTDRWKAETNIGFALYGTPAESLCYRFAEIDKKKFGVVADVTDKGYYTNSYHVDVREKIDALSKFDFESQFQTISSGGSISYVEIPNMRNNLEALEEVVKYIYDNITYAEFNTKSDYCHVCGFDGEIIINDELEWECPQCHNKDHAKMNVTRRTCGYLGENFWNVGKTKEINSRKLHL